MNQHFKNMLSDIFSGSTLLGGIFLNVDWAKVLGGIGVLCAIANHLHQIYTRNKNNKDK